ncbi:MAG TPA: hypothetical protein VD789_09190 [Thermomicrobiales bacterium]|nr:hypothetical protein [Thermomicrobiales bacterium]
MRYPHNRNPSLRGLAEPIERLAQLNIALILTQAMIVRLSIELAEDSADEPDTLLLAGFLGTCVIAGVLVVFLGRVIRRFPKRAIRITIAVGTLLLQGTAFQLLHGYAS